MVRENSEVVIICPEMFIPSPTKTCAEWVNSGYKIVGKSRDEHRKMAGRGTSTKNRMVRFVLPLILNALPRPKKHTQLVNRVQLVGQHISDGGWSSRWTHFWRLGVRSSRRIIRTKKHKTGWWFQPLWNILVNRDDYPQCLGKQKMFQTTNQKNKVWTSLRNINHIEDRWYLEHTSYWSASCGPSHRVYPCRGFLETFYFLTHRSPR